MTFLGLSEREVDEAQFTREAQWFLADLREGRSEREAAERSNVGADSLRRWNRDPAFRHALRRARRGEGYANVIFVDDEPTTAARLTVWRAGSATAPASDTARSRARD